MFKKKKKKKGKKENDGYEQFLNSIEQKNNTYKL